MNIRFWLASGLAVACLVAGAAVGRVAFTSHGDLTAKTGPRELPDAGSPLSPPAAAPGALATRLLAAIRAALDEPASATADDALRISVASLLDLGQAAALQRLLEQTPPGPVRDDLLAAFTFAWAARDPDAALAWAALRPDASERSLSLMRVCNTLGDTDPKTALALAARLDFQDRGQVLTTILEHWMLREPALARKWVLRQTPGEQRDQFMSRIASVDARHFPADAAAFALTHLPPGDTQDETIITIVHEWAARDAAGAAAWVQTFPEGEFRLRAAHEVEGMVEYLP